MTLGADTGVAITPDRPWEKIKKEIPVDKKYKANADSKINNLLLFYI